MDDKSIGNLFKHKFSQREFKMEDAYWEDAEQLIIEANRKRRKRYVAYFTGIILLLIVSSLGMLHFQNNKETQVLTSAKLDSPMDEKAPNSTQLDNTVSIGNNNGRNKPLVTADKSGARMNKNRSDEEPSQSTVTISHEKDTQSLLADPNVNAVKANENTSIGNQPQNSIDNDKEQANSSLNVASENAEAMRIPIDKTGETQMLADIKMAAPVNETVPNGIKGDDTLTPINYGGDGKAVVIANHDTPIINESASDGLPSQSTLIGGQDIDRGSSTVDVNAITTNENMPIDSLPQQLLVGDKNHADELIDLVPESTAVMSIPMDKKRATPVLANIDIDASIEEQTSGSSKVDSSTSISDADRSDRSIFSAVENGALMNKNASYGMPSQSDIITSHQIDTSSSTLDPNLSDIITIENPLTLGDENEVNDLITPQNKSAQDSTYAISVEKDTITTLPTKETVDEIQGISKKSPFSISIYGGAAYVDKLLISDQPSYDQYINRRKSEEQAIISYSAGIELDYTFNNWVFSAGVGYDKLGEKTNYLPNVKQQINSADNSYWGIAKFSYWAADSLGNPVLVELIDSNYITVSTTDTMIVPDSSITEQNGITQLAYIEVPVLIGYEFHFKKMSVIAKTGVSLAYLMRSQGDYLNRSNDQLLNIDTRPELLNSIVWNAIVNIGIKYSLNERISLLVQPVFKMNLSSVLKKQYDISQKYYSLGVRYGANYQF